MLSSALYLNLSYGSARNSPAIRWKKPKATKGFGVHLFNFGCIAVYFLYCISKNSYITRKGIGILKNIVIINSFQLQCW